MADKSEVFSWLESLSPHLKLQRLSPQFEVRGFKSRRSLNFVKSEDLEEFFPGPDSLLLAERRTLEAGLDAIRQEGKQGSSVETQRLSLNTSSTLTSQTGVFPPFFASNNHLLSPSQSQSLQSPSSLETANSDISSPLSYSVHPQFAATPIATNSQLPSTSNISVSPLDKRALEQSDKLQVLKAQVESAKIHLQKKKQEADELSVAGQRRGKVCSVCHLQGHNRAKCGNAPCASATICRMKDKHPELASDIKELQKELQALEKKYTKEKNDYDVFQAARQRARSSFFSIMRPRLRNQNQAKYIDRSVLDKDLLVLQKALNNKVPLHDTDDWQLPHLIEI